MAMAMSMALLAHGESPVFPVRDDTMRYDAIHDTIRCCLGEAKRAVDYSTLRARKLVMW